MKVRIYVQLSEIELGQSGRLDKTKSGPEQVMEVARKSFAPYTISWPKDLEWWTMYISECRRFLGASDG